MYSSPNFSKSILSSTFINIKYNNSIKTIVIKKGVNDPKRNDSPNRIKTIPKYIGFLLKLKTPPVISFVEYSKGFTVVLKRLKSLSANKFKTAPNIKNNTPTRFHEKHIKFNKGKMK